MFTEMYKLPGFLVQPKKCLPQPGSAKANGREPKNCLGRIFNFNLGCFVMRTIAWPIQVQPSLERKTRPRFCPVS